MTSRRQSKVAEAIRETVSSAILRYLRDPRIKNVTVLNAEVASDLRSAKVYVSVMGEEKTKALCLKGLESARGFLQSKVAERLDIRYTPILSFVLDHPDSPARQAERILHELAMQRVREEAAEHSEASPDDEEDDESVASEGDADAELETESDVDSEPNTAAGTEESG